jgi:hypothetical protein
VAELVVQELTVAAVGVALSEEVCVTLSTLPVVVALPVTVGVELTVALRVERDVYVVELQGLVLPPSQLPSSSM